MVTPQGGEYAVFTFVRLATLEEVDKASADGVIVAEYDGDGIWIGETVASFDPTLA